MSWWGGKPTKTISDRLVDEGANINASIKDKESSLLAMVIFSKIGGKDGLPLKVPIKGKG